MHFLQHSHYARYEQERRRARAISTGMLRAVKWGGTIGRPIGQEDAETFLEKPKSRAISKALDEGLSLREIVGMCGSSVNTVRKVKRLRKETG